MRLFYVAIRKDYLARWCVQGVYPDYFGANRAYEDIECPEGFKAIVVRRTNGDKIILKCIGPHSSDDTVVELSSQQESDSDVHYLKKKKKTELHADGPD